MIIAERILHIRDAGGPIPVPIRIDAPYDDDTAWVCNLAIGWPDGEVRSDGKGVDAVQAMELALQMVAILLYASHYHRDGTLYWQENEPGYGFQLPSGSRHLSVGFDREL